MLVSACPKEFHENSQETRKRLLIESENIAMRGTQLLTKSCGKS